VLSFGDERTEKVYLTRGFFLPTLSRQEPSRRLSGKMPEYRLIDESELMLTIYAADL